MNHVASFLRRVWAVNEVRAVTDLLSCIIEGAQRCQGNLECLWQTDSTYHCYPKYTDNDIYPLSCIIGTWRCCLCFCLADGDCPVDYAMNVLTLALVGLALTMRQLLGGSVRKPAQCIDESVRAKAIGSTAARMYAVYSEI